VILDGTPGKGLLNKVIAEVDTKTHFSGFPTNQELTEGLELLWGNAVKQFWQRLGVTWVFVALLPGPNTGRQQDLLAE